MIAPPTKGPIEEKAPETSGKSTPQKGAFIWLVKEEVDTLSSILTAITSGDDVKVTDLQVTMLRAIDVRLRLWGKNLPDKVAY